MEKEQLIHEKFIQALTLQGNDLIAEAMGLFQEILSEDPYHRGALYSVVVMHLNAGRTENALILTEYGIQINPPFAPLFFAHAETLKRLGKNAEALKAYDRVLEIQPDYPEALINSGVLLRDMFLHKESIDRFNRVLSLHPDNTSALANCAILLTEFKQNEQAIRLFERLLVVKPDYDYGLGLLCYERLHVCDWIGLEQMVQSIIEGVSAGRRSCKTLSLMAISDSASLHLKAAKTFATSHCPQQSITLWQGNRYHHQKIRVAYVSPDLREHPVGHLVAGVFEKHDKSRFEIIGISLGIDDNSRLRRRIRNACDHFIDVKTTTAYEVAQIIHQMEVDILIDLAGYTSDSRTGIFAYRPAPVQVNFLGYPGTMGTQYMDYILADRTVIPEEHPSFYTEKVIYLPDTYLPTDASIEIPARIPSRAECGLPDTGVVFCSFSHDYKILPHVFGVWMRLLQRVPNSVLWLMSRSDISQANLQREAAARGIDPNRLIFAQRVPRVEDHLARYRQADLFLDTHPYNAHTTAADAMMAGLPVITYMGGAFQSRVAASLLRAIGLPELITHSLEEYEALAFALATSPARLQDLKERLTLNKTTHPLFDTAAFCQHLEAAYIAMWRQSQLGDHPDALCLSQGISQTAQVTVHTVFQSLAAITEHYGLSVNLQQIADQYPLTEAESPSLSLITQVASAIGFKAKGINLSLDGVLMAEKNYFPMLARLTNGNGIVVVSIGPNEKFAILDPLEQDHHGVFWLSKDILAQRWSGDVILLTP